MARPPGVAQGVCQGQHKHPVTLVVLNCFPCPGPSCSPRASSDTVPVADVHVVAGGDPGLSGEVVVGGSLADRLARPDESELVLLFGGETRGDLAPCGCKDRPAGGLARVGGHVAGVRNTGAPVLVLDAGAFLDDTQGLGGELRPDVSVGNAWVRDGLDQMGVDAVNVTSVDLPGIQAEAGAPLPGVSANIRGPGVERSVVRDVGGLSVGITGVIVALRPAGGGHRAAADTGAAARAR